MICVQPKPKTKSKPKPKPKPRVRVRVRVSPLELWHGHGIAMLLAGPSSLLSASVLCVPNVFVELSAHLAIV